MTHLPNSFRPVCHLSREIRCLLTQHVRESLCTPRGLLYIDQEHVCIRSVHSWWAHVCDDATPQKKCSLSEASDRRRKFITSFKLRWSVEYVGIDNADIFLPNAKQHFSVSSNGSVSIPHGDMKIPWALHIYTESGKPIRVNTGLVILAIEDHIISRILWLWFFQKRIIQCSRALWTLLTPATRLCWFCSGHLRFLYGLRISWMCFWVLVSANMELRNRELSRKWSKFGFVRGNSLSQIESFEVWWPSCIFTN